MFGFLRNESEIFNMKIIVIVTDLLPSFIVTLFYITSKFKTQFIHT